MSRGLITVEQVKARCIVDPVTHCWLWQGATGRGQPRIYTVDHAKGDKYPMNGRRAMWNIAHGEAPPAWAKMVFACCGQKLCLNPAHLRLARDMAEMGRHIALAGWKKGKHLEANRANLAKARAVQGIVSTPEQVVLAIRAAPADITGVALAKAHGVTTSVVSSIRRGESHRHLLPQGAP